MSMFYSLCASFPIREENTTNINKTSQFVLERTDIAFPHMASSLIVTEAKSEENMSDISELPNCEDNTRGRVYCLGKRF